ncbi:MAG: carbon-nitrogen hydrolase family protein [Thermoplasmata archaeon]
MRVALVQFTPQMPGRDRNWGRILEWADATDADVVVFPELSTCGYCYRDPEELRPYTDPRDALDPLERIARQRGRLFVGGFAERDGDQTFNSAYAVSPSGTHVYRKIHLWNREKTLFQSGDHPLEVEFQGHRFGVEICYDLQFPELASYLSHTGVEAILAPTAWAQEETGPLGPLPIYTHLALATAYSHGIYVAVVNRTGTERGSVFPGQSSLTDPFGRVQHLGADEEILRTELDFSLVPRAKRPNELNDADRDARLTVHPPKVDRSPRDPNAVVVRVTG